MKSSGYQVQSTKDQSDCAFFEAGIAGSQQQVFCQQSASTAFKARKRFSMATDYAQGGDEAKRDGVYGTKVRGLFDYFHNQDFASYETPTTVQDTFSFMKTEKKQQRIMTLSNTIVPFPDDRHQHSESLRAKVDSAIHHKDNPLKISLQSSHQESQNNLQFSPSDFEAKVAVLNSRANYDNQTPYFHEREKLEKRGAQRSRVRQGKIEEVKDSGQVVQQGSAERRGSQLLQLVEMNRPIITEVTDEANNSAEEISLIISDFANTQLLNSALTMTQSIKQQESRVLNNLNQQNSSSMMVSETSYMERQNQIQQTKAVVNQLEAVRQKNLETYYSVTSDIFDHTKTGPNSKNTTMIQQQSRSNSIKNDYSTVKKKVNFDFKEEVSDQEEIELSQQTAKEQDHLKYMDQLKSKIYPKSSIDTQMFQSQQKSKLSTTSQPTSPKKKHNFLFKLEDFNMMDKVAPIISGQVSKKSENDDQQTTKKPKFQFLGVGIHTCDEDADKQSHIDTDTEKKGNNQNTPTVDSNQQKPYSSLQRTPEGLLYNDLKTGNSIEDDKDINSRQSSSIKNIFQLRQQLSSQQPDSKAGGTSQHNSQPSSPGPSYKNSSGQYHIQTEFKSRGSNKERKHNFQNSPKFFAQTLKVKSRERQYSPLINNMFQEGRNPERKQTEVVRAVTSPNFDIDISLKHSRQTCNDQCRHLNFLQSSQKTQSDKKSRKSRSSSRKRSPMRTVAARQDPYIPTYAVDISHKHSRKDCNDQCLHVPMLYDQIRQDMKKIKENPNQIEQKAIQTPNFDVRIKNNLDSPDRQSSANRVGEYTFNQDQYKYRQQSKTKIVNRHLYSSCQQPNDMINNQQIIMPVRPNSERKIDIPAVIRTTISSNSPSRQHSPLHSPRPPLGNFSSFPANIDRKTSPKPQIPLPLQLSTQNPPQISSSIPLHLIDQSNSAHTFPTHKPHHNIPLSEELASTPIAQSHANHQLKLQAPPSGSSPHGQPACSPSSINLHQLTLTNSGMVGPPTQSYQSIDRTHTLVDKNVQTSMVGVEEALGNGGQGGMKSRDANKESKNKGKGKKQKKKGGMGGQELKRYEQRMCRYVSQKEELRLRPEQNQRSKHLGMRGQLGLKELDEVYGEPKSQNQQNDTYNTQGPFQNIFEPTTGFNSASVSASTQSLTQNQNQHGQLIDEKMCINLQIQEGRVGNQSGLVKTNSHEELVYQQANCENLYMNELLQPHKHPEQLVVPLRNSMPLEQHDFEKCMPKNRHDCCVLKCKPPSQPSNHQNSSLRGSFTPNTCAQTLQLTKKSNSYLLEHYQKLKMEKQRSGEEVGLWQRSALFRKTEMVQRMRGGRLRDEGGEMGHRRDELELAREQYLMDCANQFEVNRKNAELAKKEQQIKQLELFKQQKIKEMESLKQHQAQIREVCLSKYLSEELMKKQDINNTPLYPHAQCLTSKLQEASSTTGSKKNQSTNKNEQRAGNRGLPQTYSQIYKRNNEAQFSKTSNGQNNGPRIQQMTPTDPQNHLLMKTHSPQLYYAINQNNENSRALQSSSSTGTLSRAQNSYSQSNNILIDDSSHRVPSGRLPASMISMRKSMSGKIQQYLDLKQDSDRVVHQNDQGRQKMYYGGASTPSQRQQSKESNPYFQYFRQFNATSLGGQ